MVEDNRSSGGSDSDPADYHYFGPFAPDQGTGAGSPLDADDTQPIPVGQWRDGGPGVGPVVPDPARPVYAPLGSSPATELFPAPAGVQPLRPRPPQAAMAHPPTAAGGPTRLSMRPAAVIGVAALTALVIGSAAGFGGAKLAEQPLSAGPVDPTPTATAPLPSAPASTPSARASRTPVAPPPSQVDTVQVAKAALPSTVMIRVGSGTSGGTGSGFVLDAQGRIMTNNHVVAAGGDGGRIQVVFSDGTKSTASVVGRSPSYDLAVIKVKPPASIKPMPLGDSDASQVGETVIAIGSPLGLPGTVTEGIVSAKNRPVVVGGETDAAAASAYINGIQTDASINPGNSGGPLIDGGGRVIGVNSAILTLGEARGQSGNIGLGFAIPINQAIEIADMLIKDGKATYPVIGANVDASADLAGVTLSTVEADGPAADAGLRKGDLVTAIDQAPVEGIEELIVAIRTHRPGEKVTLAYTRGGNKRSATVILGSKEG